MPTQSPGCRHWSHRSNYLRLRRLQCPGIWFFFCNDSGAVDTWNRIFQSNLKELFSLERGLLSRENLSVENCLDVDAKDQLFYVQVMVAFNRFDPRSIIHLISRRKTQNQSRTFAECLAQMRLLVRQESKNLSETLGLHEMAISLTKFDSAIAESYFILGTASFAAKDYLLAETFFKSSSVFFYKGGAFKKSLRASFTALAAFSCHAPEARLFYEYRGIAEQALAIEEYLTAATAYINISREFQILRALTTALDYADQSIQLFEKFERGSREHGLALAHRADIYFEMNMKIQGQNNLLMALTIGHREVQSACQVLLTRESIDLTALPSNEILPTWQERRDEIPPEKVVLSHLDSKLVEILSQRPQGKIELMSQLYGDIISFESRDGRFKNLLARLRNRCPQLIYLRDQKYHLAEWHRGAS